MNDLTRNDLTKNDATRAAGEATAAEGPRARDGARAFDFLMGRWKIHNRYLRRRLAGSHEWDEFEATHDARELPGGLGNEDVFRTDHAGGFTGLSFRFFDPATGKWAIYWADSRRRGAPDPPVLGSFAGDDGRFEGGDTFEGRPIRVRFVWSRTTTSTPRWEQAFSADGGRTWETNWVMDFRRDGASVAHLGDYQAVELRRYTLKAGEREHFARYFETWFPEAFEQLGAIAFGQFFERGHPDGFTWLRGFRDVDARAVVNGAFYFGPLWKEHRATLNDLIVDSDDVLLLRPLSPDRGIAVLPAVDPVREPGGARGVVVAQIFAVQADRVDDFARHAEATFAAYRAAGAREAGVLVTLDVPNNFPRLPIRTDGPFLVWLGVVGDSPTLAQGWLPLAERSADTLSATGLLRNAPELVILDPAPRSRLRWLP